MTKRNRPAATTIICAAGIVLTLALTLTARSFIWNDILRPTLDFWTP